ncbi:MAG: protein-tyrosine phosphatase family protein [Pseudomonadota bacterium]
MADLVLHTLSVGGGLLAVSQLPGKDGDYAGDFAFLRDWRPAIVLTLTTRAELVTTGAEALGQDIKESGARWLHLPVEDFGTPDATFMSAWDSVKSDALAALKGQGRVLVHCKGGCGRSGMVALRLMVEAGEPAVDALLRLRRIRPCAIETDAQMRWAVTGLSQD